MSSCTCRCPKCQPPRLVTRPLGPSVQASRPSFTAPGLSARHVLLDLHLAVDHHILAPHLHNTSQQTCRTHSFRHGRVSHHSTYFVDHIDNHSSQNEHTRVLVNLVFAISPLMSALSTPIHEQLEQKKKKKKRKERTHPNDQKPKKSQEPGHLKNEQNLVPKDMDNGSTQPSKTKLALKKRQRAQHH